MSTKKYEQLIELIINEEQDKARALFHEIVVEQSRKIYEGLIEADEEGIDEFGGNEVEDFSDDVEADESGEGMDDEFSGEEGMDDEFGGEEGSEDLEGRVMDLESALDELQAEFDELMAGEEAEEENFPGIHDEEGAEESDFDSEEGEEEFGESDEGMDEEEMVREYVEKVAAPANSEGAAVGSGGKSTSVNTKSTVAGKNDMGGSSKNIARGGGEASPDGTPATKKPSNEYAKGEKKMGQDKYENSPGAKAGSTFSKGPAAKTSEPSGVNKKSIESGKN